MAFTLTERWYFSTPVAEAKRALTDELELPWELADLGDGEEAVTIKGSDRATLEAIFSRLEIPEPTLIDEDDRPVALAAYDFELCFVPDWDGPFEWIMEISFSEEEMADWEWPYLQAVAAALAVKLGGKHQGDRTGEEIIAEGHIWAPPPPIRKV